MSIFVVSFFELNVAILFTGFDARCCEHPIGVDDRLICTLGDVVSFSNICAPCALLGLEVSVVIFSFNCDVLISEDDLVVVGDDEDDEVVDEERLFLTCS